MKTKTINGWTKQSMIQHIKDNFKGKSTRSDTSRICMYRNPEGAKCAVGLFIPDHVYEDGMEAAGLFTVASAKYPYLMNYMPLKLHFMVSLQAIHDNSDKSDTLNSMLAYVEGMVEE